MKSIQKTLVVAVIVAVVAVGARQLRANLLSHATTPIEMRGILCGRAAAASITTVRWLVPWSGRYFAPTCSRSNLATAAGMSRHRTSWSTRTSLRTLAASISQRWMPTIIIPSPPRPMLGRLGFSGSPGMVPAVSTLINGGASGYAEWYFNDPDTDDGILTGQWSDGLAYSSLNSPEIDSGQAINGGGNISFPLPGPSANPAVIPEPSTMLLLAFTAVLVGLGVRFRR